MTGPETLADRLYTLIIDSGRGRTDFLHNCVYSRSTAYQWLNGRTLPDCWHLARISDYYGVTTDWIIKGGPRKRSDGSEWPYTMSLEEYRAEYEKRLEKPDKPV